MLGAGKDENNPFTGFVHGENVHHRLIFTGLYIQRAIDDIEQFDVVFRSAESMTRVVRGESFRYQRVA